MLLLLLLLLGMLLLFLPLLRMLLLSYVNGDNERVRWQPTASTSVWLSDSDVDGTSLPFLNPTEIQKVRCSSFSPPVSR